MIASLLIPPLLLFDLQVRWISSRDPWYAGDFLCRVFMSVRVFGQYMSAASVFCITLDRYMAVCHPLRTAKAVRRAKMMLLVSGILSGILSFFEVKIDRRTVVLRSSGIPFVAVLICYRRVLQTMSTREAGK